MLSRFRLARAYREVFSTDAGRLVLRDLATHSGFYRITEMGASSEQIQYAEGMRAVFWRVFAYLRLTHSDMAQLAREAREQSQSQNQDEDGADEYV